MNIERFEKVSACALNRIFGYEPLVARHLVDTLGNCSGVFSLTGSELREIAGTGFKYSDKINDSALEAAERELERLQNQGCDFVAVTSADYPDLLKDCEDAPVGLYFKGTSSPGEVFNSLPCISIVGTRDLSPYGKEWCERIVRGIADAGKACIVSGLALGVDITAHMAALACGLPTISVMPTGIDEVYPRRHRIPAGKIASSPGSALITDFPPGTGAQAFTFLRRNRIIAAMSASTILIESKAKGGGMITARLASGYGRNVFCVPGRMDDLRSQGCNFLIQEKIAEIIGSIESLVRELGLHPSEKAGKNLADTVAEHYLGTLPEENVRELSRVAAIIEAQRGIDIEEIGRRADIGYSRASRDTALLEADGYISIDLMQRCIINACCKLPAPRRMS